VNSLCELVFKISRQASGLQMTEEDDDDYDELSDHNCAVINKMRVWGIQV